MPGKSLIKYASFAVILVIFLFAINSCALRSKSVFRTGSKKNSLPFVDTTLIKQVHSIFIPPFYGDNYHLRKSAVQIIASRSKASILPLKTGDDSVKKEIDKLSSLPPEDRIAHLENIGKLVSADAVLNGVVLKKGKSNELIMQLMSAGNSKIIWWQAVDFTLEKPPVQKEREALLFQMLTPLVSYLGTKEKPLHAAPKKQNRQTESVQKPLLKKQQHRKPPKAVKPAPDSNTEGEKQPVKGPEQIPQDISPM